eukprot:superscaffoldBa00009123_g23872
MGSGHSQEDYERYALSWYELALNTCVLPDVSIDDSLVKFSGINSNAELQSFSKELVDSVPGYIEKLGGGIIKYAQLFRDPIECWNMGSGPSQEDYERYALSWYELALNTCVLPDVSIDDSLVKFSGINSNAELQSYSKELVVSVPGYIEKLGLLRVTHERILRSLHADFHQWRVNSFILQPAAMATPRKDW